MPWLHDIDPIAFELGPLTMRWYGLMYLAGYLAALILGLHRLRAGRLPVTTAAFLDLIFYDARRDPRRAAHVSRVTT